MDKKREKQLKDEYWKQINEDFERLAENERYMQQKLKYEKEFGQEDKFIEEQDEQNRLLREKQLNDEYWKKINEDFEKLAENERYMQQKIKYEKKLKQRDAQLKQIDSQIEQIDTLLEEKDAQLKQLDALILEKENQLKQAYQKMLDDGYSAEQLAKYFDLDIIKN